MSKANIGTQIIGILFIAGGCYLIHDTSIIIGVLFVIWGNNMRYTPTELKKRRVVKDWLGNTHLED